MKVPAQGEGNAEGGVSAGRGGLFVLFAKVFFIASGLLQQIFLPRVIGQANYGALSIVFAFSNVLNNVVVAASIQSASRVVVEARGQHDSALRAVLRLHAPMALVLGLTFAGVSPLLARFEHAESLWMPIALMALVLSSYAVYAPIVGSLNGRKAFSKQALLDVTFATMRTSGLLGLGYFFTRRGVGVLGAALGVVCAALLIVPISWVVSHRGPKPEATARAEATAPYTLDTKAYLRGLLSLALIQLSTNMLMQIDIILLGRSLSSTGAEAAAHDWVGVYRACQVFAFLPYQLLFAVTQVLFPMVATARAAGDRDLVRTYVERGARIALLFAGLMVAVMAALPRGIVGLVYESTIATRAAVTMRILTVGQGAFAILGVTATVLASLGKEKRGAMATAFALVLTMVAQFFLVPRFAFGEAQLIITASLVFASLILGLALGWWSVVREVGGFIPFATSVRVILAIGVTIGAGVLIGPTSKLMTIVYAPLCAALYLGALFLTRELGSKDLELVRTLAKRKR